MGRPPPDDVFEELLVRCRRPVLNFVYRLLGDAAEAEDVAQEVFVRAYQCWADYDPRRKLSTWLFALARNAAIDRLRHRQRHPAEPLDSVPEPSVVSREVETREIGEQIAAAIQSLPEDQRTAIVLFEYHGLSVAEIAEVMHCSQKSVESRLYRARQTLRRRLAAFLE
ncbi:MAG: sigma-70 family RNA polymerase sigma factor [Verrucomicrobiae bacterium]|nr:sigma-70 family RNA polymerase sigma factor [Verrucomicrobiae bacterium]